MRHCHRGSRGLGEAIVRRLVEAGASVVLAGRGLDALQRVESEINAAGGQALGVQADLASLTDSQKVIDRTVERFGRVDILVNNAAVFPPSLFMEVSEEVFDQTVDTDLKGAWRPEPSWSLHLKIFCQKDTRLRIQN